MLYNHAMSKHNAPKVITFPIEPIRSSIENIVHHLMTWGFQLPRVYESVYSSDSKPDEERNKVIALTLLMDCGFLGKRNVGIKTIKLITEAANELNLTNFPFYRHFGFLEIERDLVRLVADRMLQSCLDLQEKLSHQV